ncbi:hypothetical protein BO83DRAFT_402580 [Aspergillus eucalypticola CBS 122712]|uniref:Uncharacterized protein n=1 Tax=Aspergillus eucalypticola (strain CBS 122712 / IBT 29274) TaxID=1448314 RepID=A0A317UR21_ASPEC|nr:uncharacterized protein BO83DRAFT_402580 [Aspergillus eucalypticola CBS 122712]PWY64473.1 hypothetical protein BO83DRAFT_402580 [Aspergillus eucalypticola CBS 122712]
MAEGGWRFKERQRGGETRVGWMRSARKVPGTGGWGRAGAGMHGTGLDWVRVPVSAPDTGPTGGTLGKSRANWTQPISKRRASEEKRQMRLAGVAANSGDDGFPNVSPLTRIHFPRRATSESTDRKANLLDRVDRRRLKIKPRWEQSSRKEITRVQSQNQLRKETTIVLFQPVCVCQVRSNPMPSHPPSAEAVRVRLCLPARSGHHAARGVIGLPPGAIRRQPSTERGCARGMRCMVGMVGHCSDSARPPGAVNEDGGMCSLDRGGGSGWEEAHQARGKRGLDVHRDKPLTNSSGIRSSGGSADDGDETKVGKWRDRKTQAGRDGGSSGRDVL